MYVCMCIYIYIYIYIYRNVLTSFPYQCTLYTTQSIIYPSLRFEAQSYQIKTKNKNALVRNYLIINIATLSSPFCLILFFDQETFLGFKGCVHYIVSSLFF